MTDAVYATRRDVYTYALARGSLANPGRIVASSTAATDALELAEHGFESGDAVTVRALEGGTLSAPLVDGTLYYVLRLTDSTFKLAATSGGSPINLSTDGAEMVVSTDLPFEEVLEYYSRFVEPFLPAHVVPMTAPYPKTVVGIVAQLAARRLQLIAGVSSESMKELELAAGAQLERWAKGIPLRDPKATASANLAVSATLGSSSDQGTIP